MMSSPVLTIDVAHPPLRPDEVEDELFRAWSQVRNSSSHRILKVIHGYGSTSKGGTTKETVRNWAFRNKGRLKKIIHGEEYVLYQADTQEMRKEVGVYEDTDLGSGNAGVTILWVK